jgi:isopentenyl-diphosphate Delta-isomerase
MTATEQVILVDSNDNPIGTAEKIDAHQRGLCHRAFSVFVLRDAKTPEILLQQRAKGKYHSPNLWTNTCCSHPRPHESTLEAAERRLYEEMGLRISLTTLGWFHYLAQFPNGLIENEVDHVLIGTIEKDQPVHLNPYEAQQCRWVSIPALKSELAHSPEQFTPWLKEALQIVETSIDKW